MSREALESVGPELLKMSEVRTPDMPVEIYLQEAETLRELVSEEGVRTPLLEVGLPQEALDALPVAIGAARHAESEWTAVRSPRKPQEQRDLEKQAYALRSRAMSACRFSLRSNRMVQGALDRVVEGEGIADLTQDLYDLGLIVEQNVAGFARNQRFNAAEMTGKLRATAEELRRGQAGFATDKTQRDAVDLRNRAWTWLDDLVVEIRDAGQHAFEGTPTTREFASVYARAQRRAQRRRRAEAATQPS